MKRQSKQSGFVGLAVFAGIGLGVALLAFLATFITSQKAAIPNSKANLKIPVPVMPSPKFPSPKNSLTQPVILPIEIASPTPIGTPTASPTTLPSATTSSSAQPEQTLPAM